MSEFITEINESGRVVRFIQSTEILSIEHGLQHGIYRVTLKNGSKILINSCVYDLRSVLKTNLEHVQRVKS